MTLQHEDGDDDSQPPPTGRKDRRRVSLEGSNKKRGLERRRSRRASLGRSGHASPSSPASPRAGFRPFSGRGAEDASERWEEEEGVRKMCPFRLRRWGVGVFHRCKNWKWCQTRINLANWDREWSSDCLVPILSAAEHFQVCFHPCKFNIVWAKGHLNTLLLTCDSH